MRRHCAGVKARARTRNGRYAAVRLGGSGRRDVGIATARGSSGRAAVRAPPYAPGVAEAALIRTEPPDERGVARLVLDRPERRNALSIELRDRVSEAVGELAADDATKVLVLTGAGETFSAGFDLAEFTDPAVDQDELWASSDRFHHAVLRAPFATVAAVNGPAIAGGFDLAVLCDLRVASSTAWFSHPEVAFGDVVYSPLREVIGGAVARELCLTGRRVEAAEALALHLVSSVHPPSELSAAADALAASIAAAPADLLRRTKAKIVARTDIDAGTRTLDL